MRVCKYLNQRVRRIGEQNRKSFKGVFTTVYRLQESAWKNACVMTVLTKKQYQKFVFFNLLKSKHHQLTITRSYYVTILLKSLKGLELVSSLHHIATVKQVENVCHKLHLYLTMFYFDTK